MIALAQCLDRGGHDVLIAGPPDHVTAAERRRLRYHAYGHSIDTFLADTAADYAGGARRSHRALNRVIEMAIDDEFAELPTLARDFDLIVGAGVQAGAPSVAELLGIPYRYVVYCTALVKSPQSLPMLFPARSLPRWCIPLAWRLVQWGYNLSSRKQVNAHRTALGMAPIADIYSHVLTERPLLACDEALWPVPADATPAPAQVGYLSCPTNDPCRASSRPSSAAATRRSMLGSALPARLTPTPPRASSSRRSGSLDMAA
jgi:vancomycin aglycone glucosyltransferase